MRSYPRKQATNIDGVSSAQQGHRFDTNTDHKHVERFFTQFVKEHITNYMHKYCKVRCHNQVLIGACGVDMFLSFAQLNRSR